MRTFTDFFCSSLSRGCSLIPSRRQVIQLRHDGKPLPPFLQCKDMDSTRIEGGMSNAVRDGRGV